MSANISLRYLKYITEGRGNMKTQILLRLPIDLKEDAVKLAQELGFSLNTVIIQALREYLDKQQRKSKGT